MMRALIEHIANPNFGTYSLVFLFLFFVVLFWWTYLVVPRSIHDQHALIPFNDEDKTAASASSRSNRNNGESHD